MALDPYPEDDTQPRRARTPFGADPARRYTPGRNDSRQRSVPGSTQNRNNRGQGADPWGGSPIRFSGVPAGATGPDPWGGAPIAFKPAASAYSSIPKTSPSSSAWVSTDKAEAQKIRKQYQTPAAPAAPQPDFESWQGGILAKNPAIGQAGTPENAAFAKAFNETLQSTGDANAAMRAAEASLAPPAPRPSLAQQDNTLFVPPPALDLRAYN